MAATDGHERSPRTTPNKAKVLKDKQTRGWTEKQQKETDDTGLHMQYKEDKKQCLSGFILPSLNTSGFAHASRVAHVTSPATKAKVKADKGEEERQQLDKVPPEKKRATGSSRRDKDHRKGHGQHFPAKLTRDTSGHSAAQKFADKGTSSLNI
ncbi:uncharacterized protein LOC112162245 isoform X2 [Oryzias melastigma]|uniref:uncharacterized protein LOC112162245 isoform X2 n=1 Tax=Oryzias melastigma TaxID=30732 RepID=UPI00168D5B0A|nr:uncharacterized protein LOC112162245 isoform X2 [Oryzias melastigma]